jgi:hypothetical protein
VPTDAAAAHAEGYGRFAPIRSFAETDDLLLLLGADPESLPAPSDSLGDGGGSRSGGGAVAAAPTGAGGLTLVRAASSSSRQIMGRSN